MSTPTIPTTNPRLIIAEYYDLLANQVNVYARELVNKCGHQDLDETRKTLWPQVQQLKNNLLKRKSQSDKTEEETFDIEWYQDPYSEAFTSLSFEEDNLDNRLEEDKYEEVERKLSMREYVNAIKSNVIEELRKAEHASLEWYERKKSTIDLYIDRPLSASRDFDDEVNDELKSLLFVPEFCFLLHMEHFAAYNKIDNPNIFKMYAVFTDFYMSSSLLELLWYEKKLLLFFSIF